MAGKGDKYRPVDRKKFEEGWERAFGKKDETEKQNTKATKPRKNRKTP